MRTEPVDLDLAGLKEALRTWWAVSATSLDYCARGFGSHHWVASDAAGDQWFVTVDDLRSGRIGAHEDDPFTSLDTAFRAAVVLRDEAELEFVVAPLVDRHRAVLRPLGAHYAVSLFPFLDGESSDDGAYRSDRDRHEVLRLLGRLHRATFTLPSILTHREDFAVPRRSDLIQALQDLDRPWTTGPFAEPTRKLLQACASDVRATLDRYDGLVTEVSASPASWVVTHGEPHAGNVIWGRQNRPWLIDWDTVALGPRERDLWMVVGNGAADLSAYSEAAGTEACSPSAIVLYRLWWGLAEIAEYVFRFRQEHDETDDTKAAWVDLSKYLPVRREFLD